MLRTSARREAEGLMLIGTRAARCGRGGAHKCACGGVAGRSGSDASGVCGGKGSAQVRFPICGARRGSVWVGCPDGMALLKS